MCEKKRQVAEYALKYVHEGEILGVGTGSTVDYFLEALDASGMRLAGAVSSSDRTTQKLRAMGIDVVDANTAGELSVYIDGADEATEFGALIKGGGGALTREKVLANASRQFVCMIDDSKLKPVLGTFPVAVEVLPMARSFVARKILAMRGNPEYRQGFETDNGNIIIDVHDLDLTNPQEVEHQLNHIPGVVCHGIFAKRGADVLLVSDGQTIHVKE